MLNNLNITPVLVVKLAVTEDEAACDHLPEFQAYLGPVVEFDEIGLFTPAGD
jgi:hypothetical protein